MRYIRVHWIHQLPDEPVELLSELDEDSREVRKVEVFRDGSCGFADATEALGSTRLGLEPVPSLEEMALDTQFRPSMITRSEFNRVWEAARSVGQARESIAGL